MHAGDEDAEGFDGDGLDVVGGVVDQAQNGFADFFFGCGVDHLGGVDVMHVGGCGIGVGCGCVRGRGVHGGEVGGGGVQRESVLFEGVAQIACGHVSLILVGCDDVCDDVIDIDGWMDGWMYIYGEIGRCREMIDGKEGTHNVMQSQVK